MLVQLLSYEENEFIGKETELKTKRLCGFKQAE